MNSMLPSALALGALLVLVAPPATAQTPVIGPALPPLVIEGFEPIGKYQVLQDGSPVDDGHVALSKPAGSVYLLQGEGLGHGVLIRPQERDVVRLPEGAVQEQLDGRLTVHAEGPPDVVGAFEVDKEGLFFELGDATFRLAAGEILLGDRTTDELLARQDGYRFRARQFAPDAAAMEALRRAPDTVRVKTFFGSWCSACAVKLPRLLRIAGDLSGAALHFDYYGVPTPFKDEPVSTRFGVTSVPTGVVLVAGKEVGRLVGDDWEHPGKALAAMLAEAGVLKS